MEMPPTYDEACRQRVKLPATAAIDVPIMMIEHVPTGLHGVTESFMFLNGWALITWLQGPSYDVDGTGLTSVVYGRLMTLSLLVNLFYIEICSTRLTRRRPEFTVMDRVDVRRIGARYLHVLMFLWTGHLWFFYAAGPVSTDNLWIPWFHLLTSLVNALFVYYLFLRYMLTKNLH